MFITMVEFKTEHRYYVCSLHVGNTNIAGYKFVVNCAWYTTVQQGNRVLCYIMGVVLDKPTLRVSPVPYSTVVHVPRVFISCPSVCPHSPPSLPHHSPFSASLSPPLTTFHSLLYSLHSRAITRIASVLGLACTVQSRNRNNTNPIPSLSFSFFSLLHLLFTSQFRTKPISTRK